MATGGWLQARIQRIDQEIVDLAIQMSSLRTERNSLMPISRLPPEILTSVFWFSLPDLGETHPHGPDGDYDALHTLARVSRFWKDTIFHSPSLWTRPTLKFNDRAVHQMIMRAKDMPLTLYVDRYTRCENVEKTLSVCLEKAARVHVVQGSPYSDTVFSKILGNGAPLLHELEVFSDVLQSRVALSHTQLSHSSLFPMLQTLRISGAQLTPWIGHQYPRLKYLSLVQDLISARENVQVTYPASEVWELIGSIVDLEVLTLRCAIKEIPPHLPTLHLPRLKELHIRCYPDMMANWLSRLQLPPSTLIFLDMEVQDKQHLFPDCVRELFTVIQSRSGFHRCIARMTLSLREIRLDWHDRADPPRADRRMSSLVLHGHCDLSQRQCFVLGLAFLRALPQFPIEALTVDGAEFSHQLGDDPHFEKYNFGRLLLEIAGRDVQELNASGIAIGHVCSSLYVILRNQTTPPARFFPTISFRYGRGTGLNDLLQLLRQYQSDTPLRTLRLHGLEELPEELEHDLGSVVPQVVTGDCLRQSRSSSRPAAIHRDASLVTVDYLPLSRHGPHRISMDLPDVGPIVGYFNPPTPPLPAPIRFIRD